MRTLLVDCELKQPAHHTRRFLRTMLTRFEGHAQVLDSAWLIVTAEPQRRVAEQLSAALKPSDTLFVQDVTGCAWAAAGVRRNIAEWLTRNL